MAKQQETKETKLSPSVSFQVNTKFSANVCQALLNYQKENGLLFPQEVVRLAVSNFLKKSGHLH